MELTLNYLVLKAILTLLLAWLYLITPPQKLKYDIEFYFFYFSPGGAHLF